VGADLRTARRFDLGASGHRAVQGGDDPGSIENPRSDGSVNSRPTARPYWHQEDLMTDNADATLPFPDPSEPDSEGAPWPAMDEESPTLATDSPSRSAEPTPVDPSAPPPS